MYNNWMSFLKDDVLLTKAVIPSAHNAGTYGMPATARCQNHSLYTQTQYGIRHFCIRLDTNRKGEIVLAHGPSKGDLLRHALSDLGKAMTENPSEFYILDMREYYPQKIGPLNLTYHAEPSKVNELVAEFLQPEKYALTDFEDISKVTMGEIRRQGKRFLLLNYRKDYAYSTDCPHIIPWDKQIFGSKPESFAKNCLTMFDLHHTEGIYWFQTQQTPNFGTEIGFRFPKNLNKSLLPYYPSIIKAIADTPYYLEQANVIAGDFMTEDYNKVCAILLLNLNKGTIIEEKAEKFRLELEEKL